MNSGPTDEILLVLGVGGPALDYTLPRVAARGNVHVLTLAPPSDFAQAQIDQHGASVMAADLPDDAPLSDVAGAIVNRARAVMATAVITFSEYAVCAAAQACEELGLRGAGPGAARSRDKILMRERWTERGVPGPAWHAVYKAADLLAACDRLTMPFLLKPALSAGSIGQQIITAPKDAQPAFEQATAALANAATFGDAEYGGSDGLRLLAEDIIPASTEGWYDDPRYGDYLSVEGVVVDGTYFPVCITARLPTIAPFTELSNQAPCPLPESLQRRIEATARQAVDALELGTCGTHTELKLLPNGQLSMLETAARLPGAMVVREVEEVFGVDLVGALVDGLLGRPTGLPDTMLVPGDHVTRAAASLALIATDSEGHPWTSLPTFRPDDVDWSQLVGAGTTVEIVTAQTLESGVPMPRYDPGSGVLNFAGLAFVMAEDPSALLADTLAILDGLEDAMCHVDRQPATTDAS